MDTLKTITKALAGGIVAGLGAAGVALADGTVSPLEWTIIASTTIVGTGIVYAVPNTPQEVENKHVAD